MTLVDYLRLLRRQWYVVVAFVVLGLVGGAMVSAVVPAVYAASTQLYFSTVAAPGSSSVSPYETNLLAQQQLKSVALLVGTERVAQDVIDDLRLDQTPGEVSSHVSATSDPDTVILAVNAQDPSPQRAADIANSTGRALIRLTESINRESATAGLPAAKAEVIQVAVVPDAPSRGAPVANLLGGVLVGLLLGLLAVLLRRLLDHVVRSGDEVAATTSAPLLGTLPYTSGLAVRPLTLVEDSDGPLAAAYRQLRVKVGVRMADSRVLAVAGTRRADGRTLTVANLALAFAESGCRVALIEADLRNPRLGDYFGFGDEPGLAEVLAGQRDMAEVIRSWRGQFDLVLAGRGREDVSRLVASSRLLTALEELKKDHDIVLIDTPAFTAPSDVSYIVSCTDATLLVARHGATHSAALTEMASSLGQSGSDVIGCVLTAWQTGARRPWSSRRSVAVAPAAVARRDVPPSGTESPPATAGRTRCLPHRPGPRPPAAGPLPSPGPRVAAGPGIAGSRPVGSVPPVPVMSVPMAAAPAPPAAEKAGPAETVDAAGTAEPEAAEPAAETTAEPVGSEPHAAGAAAKDPAVTGAAVRGQGK